MMESLYIKSQTESYWTGVLSTAKKFLQFE
jgi:hypothetical protein